MQACGTLRSIPAALLALCVTASASHASVRFVNAVAAGTGDGSSWANAHTNLRTALVAAQPGDELWVAQGTYVPGNTPAASDTFQLRSGIALYGGFTGIETSRAQRDWNAHATVLSGDIAGDDVYVGGTVYFGWNIGAAGNSAHVVTGSGVDATAVLDGFSVVHGAIGLPGTPAGSWDMYGSGLFNVAGNPTVRNCTFAYNLAAFGEGGAIYNYDSSPTIEGCRFVENYVHLGNGGAISNYGACSPVIRDCTFLENETVYSSGYWGSGGAIACNGTPPITIERCTFERNVARNFYSAGQSDVARGGAIHYFGDGLVLRDCIFRANQAPAGGAVFVWGSSSISGCLFIDNLCYSVDLMSGVSGGGYGGALASSCGATDVVTLANCVVARNQSSEAAVQAVWNASPTRVRNSILWGNTSSDPQLSPRERQIKGGFDADYSCIQSLLDTIPGEDPPDPSNYPGCTQANPAFVDFAAGDLRLAAASPCIDTGSNSLVVSGVVADLLGNARSVRGLPGAGPAIVDMGAYEFGSTPASICPGIVRQPSSAMATSGGSAGFGVVASGSAALTFEWRRNGVALSDGADVHGSATSLLVLTSVDAADAGAYDVRITNGCGTTTSSAATLSVLPATVGQAFCTGDGLDPQVTTPCPCANEGVAGHGCANSANAGGASLAAHGSTAPDTVVLLASGLPSSTTCIFLKGDVDNVVGNLFGDGVRCVDGALVRLGTVVAVSGVAQYPSGSQSPVSVRGDTPPGSGLTGWYQTYYRNAASYCTAETFNVTGGWRIDW